MRHSLHTEIEIDAPPEQVWSVLTDLDRYAAWNPFITSASGVVAVGERLENHIEPPGGRAATFKPTVTEVEQAHVFEWLGRPVLPGIFDGRHRFELHPIAGGRTRFVHTEQFRGLLVRPLLRSFEEPTRAGFEAMNEALKARVEAQAGATS